MNSMIRKARTLHDFTRLLLSKEWSDKTALHQARRVVADTVGAAYAGTGLPAFTIPVSSKEVAFGEGPFTLWGTQLSSSLPGAAFFNALAASGTDFDEGHRKAAGHPAVCVVPVALVLGEHMGSSFTDVLRSVLVGYEAGVRFSAARQPKSISTYSTGRWGAIAAASAASVLLDLTVEQTMHALSLAYITSPAMQGGSTDVSTGSMAKEGVAWAAWAGLQAALLARQGFNGPFLFIDGYDEIDRHKLLDEPTGKWLIESNYFKPFACCRWLHTAVQLLIDLKKENHIQTGMIDSIEVGIFKRAIDLIESPFPGNTLQAQFHLPFTLACALQFDKVTPEEMSPETLSRKDIRELTERITLVSENRFTETFPGRLGSSVLLRLKDGTLFQSESIKAPWDAENPATDEDLFRKFSSLVGDEAEKLWHQFMNSV